jgi:hypothetical protein
MTVNIEVAEYKIQDAVLPTFDVRVRVRYEHSRQAYFGLALCEIYYGKAIGNARYLTSSPTTIARNVRPNTDFDFRFYLTFSQEMLRAIDKQRSPQDDAHFVIWTRMPVIFTDQAGDIAGFEHAHCNFDIAMSNWVKIAFDWAKDMALMPIDPKLYERLQEIARDHKYLKSPNEVIDELVNRFDKQTTD